MQKTRRAKRINTRKLAERFAVELGAPAVFFVTLMVASLVAATIAFALATAAAAAYSWLRSGRIPLIPIAMTVAAVAFGGLTIVMNDPMWIQIRASLINATSAGVIVYGLTHDRLFLKEALQDGFRMSDATWRTLSWRMAGFLLLLALLNEVIWRSTSTDTWAAFKAAVPVLNLVFFALNWPLIRERAKGVEPDGDAASEAA